MLRELAPGFESGQLTAPAEKDMSLVGLHQAIDAYSGKVKKAVIVLDWLSRCKGVLADARASAK